MIVLDVFGRRQNITPQTTTTTAAGRQRATTENDAEGPQSFLQQVRKCLNDKKAQRAREGAEGGGALVAGHSCPRAAGAGPTDGVTARLHGAQDALPGVCRTRLQVGTGSLRIRRQVTTTPRGSGWSAAFLSPSTPFATFCLRRVIRSAATCWLASRTQRHSAPSQLLRRAVWWERQQRHLLFPRGVSEGMSSYHDRRGDAFQSFHTLSAAATFAGAFGI